MLWLKQCQRCGGDLYLEHDAYGQYLTCLQCGHHVEIKQQAGLARARAGA